ncbi:HAD family phosphatase [Pigmentibacter sp. JX0631]|uniref:HAD family hydrolase n=1 Tax=Pigmentibacter sp. JX0631 TaxID=2976982 RepID=UPI0024689E23|nr:HAD family phosphatase [Pigmentibacter sp. JX0631]WGL58547.1 HAD family phosphatase [Pigmentibacter sp. JX0631]
MEKKHIIFDFNGVIVDDEKIHFLSSQLALKEIFNHDLSQELYFKFFIGRTNEKAFEDYFKMLDIDSSIAEIIKIKNKIYMQLVETENVAIPSTISFIRKYKNDFSYSVVSGASKNEIWFHLKKLGIENLFLNILSCEDITESKPSPQGFLKAINLSHIPANQTVIIEDSISGVRAAKAANTFCIALTTSHTKEELHQADIVVSELNISCFNFD